MKRYTKFGKREYCSIIALPSVVDSQHWMSAISEMNHENDLPMKVDEIIHDFAGQVTFQDIRRLTADTLLFQHLRSHHLFDILMSDLDVRCKIFVMILD